MNSRLVRAKFDSTSYKIRPLLLRKYNNMCAICGSKDKLEIDHIIPISGGGGNEIENLQILCRACNIKKGGIKTYKPKEKRISKSISLPESIMKKAEQFAKKEHRSLNNYIEVALREYFNNQLSQTNKTK